MYVHPDPAECRLTTACEVREDFWATEVTNGPSGGLAPGVKTFSRAERPAPSCPRHARKGARR